MGKTAVLLLVLVLIASSTASFLPVKAGKGLLHNEEGNVSRAIPFFLFA